MARKKFLFSWPGYFAKHLISAEVNNVNKKNVVLTFFPSVKPFNDTIKESFALDGKVIDLLTVDNTAGTVTIRVEVAYVEGLDFELIFDPTINPGKKGAIVTQTISNNVAD